MAPNRLCTIDTPFFRLTHNNGRFGSVVPIRVRITVVTRNNPLCETLPSEMESDGKAVGCSSKIAEAIPKQTVLENCRTPINPS